MRGMVGLPSTKKGLGVEGGVFAMSWTTRTEGDFSASEFAGVLVTGGFSSAESMVVSVTAMASFSESIATGVTVTTGSEGLAFMVRLGCWVDV